MMAHNLGREIQMLATPRHTYSHAKRPAAWVFQTLATLRHRFIRRAGRLTEPQGELTLTLSPKDPATLMMRSIRSVISLTFRSKSVSVSTFLSVGPSAHSSRSHTAASSRPPGKM